MHLRIPRRRIRILGRWTDTVNPIDQRPQYRLWFRSRTKTPLIEPEFSFFLQEWLDGGVPFTVWVGVDHSLESDIFVKPDGPINAMLVVDA